MVFRLIPLVIAYPLLAAHFLRGGNPFLTMLCLLIPFLLLIKKRWSLIIVQGSLFLGAWIWVRAAIIIIHERMMLGISWWKVLIILGPIALFTLLAGLLLNSSVVRDKYPSKI